MIYLYPVFNYDLLWPFLYLSWLLRRTLAAGRTRVEMARSVEMARRGWM